MKDGPDHVVIDRTKPAYSVFAGISDERLEEIRPQLAESESIEILSWEEFEKDSAKHVKKSVVRNEYPSVNITAGIVVAMQRLEGAPIGVTWNGGIAFTYQDYQFAKKLHEKFQVDEAQYERTRSLDPREDPLNPRIQFQGLLGEDYESDQ